MRVAHVVAIVVAALPLLQSCAPTTRLSEQCAQYTGPIETLAVVPELGWVDSSLEALIQNEARYQLSIHPCTHSRFDVVERSGLPALLREHNLHRNSYLASDAPRIGRLVGAQYLLFVQIVSADVEYFDSGTQEVFNRQVRIAGYIAVVGVSMRLVDAESGVVVSSANSVRSAVLPSSITVDGRSTRAETASLVARFAYPAAVGSAIDAIFARL